MAVGGSCWGWVVMAFEVYVPANLRWRQVIDWYETAIVDLPIGYARGQRML